MTKQEFLSQLRNALGSRVDSYIVNENVSYYEEYIATQVRAGKSEETVIEELGNPRLLARSIADANKRAGASEVEGEDESRDNEEHPMYRTYNLPGLNRAWNEYFFLPIDGMNFFVAQIPFQK